MEKISVIVPVYNGERTIRVLIESLLKQDYPDKEIIIVDDGSTDRTAAVVREFPSVVLLTQTNAGPATARNRGAREARGAILCFTDADCVARPDWVSRLVKAFGAEQVGAVAGTYGIVNQDARLARCVHEEIMYRHGKLMKQYVRVFGSYNCAVRKNIFEAAGGFDQRYRNASGEDNDLSYKILKAGHKIFFERNAVVDHVHPAKVEKYLRAQFQHGYWRAKMYRDHPEMSKGDDYTFWKDGAEVALVLTGLLLCCLALHWPLLWIFSFLLVGILYLIEFLFAFLMHKRLTDVYFFSSVMFLRSFARAFGLLTGFFRRK